MGDEGGGGAGPGGRPRPVMKGGAMVWVGRVKSTVAPALLQDAFDKMGKVIHVQTGFAGFAFVEFELEEDAEKAVKQMNKAIVQGVGEIRVAKATVRGYQDAVSKREDYWKTRGGSTHLSLGQKGDKGRDRGGRQRSGSRSPRRGDSQSRSPRRERYRSPSGSRSRSRSRSQSRRRRSASRSRRPSPGGSPRREAEEEKPPPSRNSRPRSGDGAGDEGAPSEGPGRGDVLAVVDDGKRGANGEDARSEQGDCGQLSPADRADVVCFFDGTSAPELLLEGAAVLRVPDYFVPNVLNGLPHGFQGMSQEGAMMLMKVLSAFSSNANAEDGAASVEVRQSLIVDSSGRRVLKKSIVIDGTNYSSEERVIGI